ncbi:uncharacterized protein CLIB1444_13S01948 [[Candida] jaroonii]|uniref:Uncharacterized protein n=1 Tax=[Candida] jaroonii TaxID=467808 RepID=A0ACA9YDN3_9ASCO|nr:uncharacterized protein CLIB1444_13S01948 [[Candida] jaroonii]
MEVTLTKDDIFLPEYRGRLTEGISFNKNINAVLWVDIRLAQLHRYKLDSSKHEVLELPEGESMGTMGFTSDNDVYLIGTKNGISRANFNTKEITFLKEYPTDNAKLRSNEGKVDPWGNMIIGTMCDFPYEHNMEPIGTLYRINSSLDMEILETDCFVPNGLGFNAEKTKFFWVDSETNTIFQYDYDPQTHEFSNKQPFFKLVQFCEGAPDGMFLSTKEEFWVATFGGSCVLRINMKGELVQKFNIPAKQVTCMTIGGGYLWINTCLIGSTDLKNKAELTTEGDLGGYLFKYKLDEDVGEEAQYLFNFQ